MAMPRMFKTRIEIPVEARERLIALLNQQLADTFDLFSQVKQAHWNVKGPHFIALHELFDDLAEILEAHGDSLAERTTALGGYALGTVRMSAAASRLPEYPQEATDGMTHVAALADRYGVYAASTRAAIDAAGEYGDQDTADLFTAISRDIDKHLWFLEAHLQS